MLVRPATADDLDGYLACFEAVVGEGIWLGAEPPVDRHRVRARVEEALAATDATLLLAWDADAIVGSIHLHAAGGVVGFGMLVAAGHRGRGVGRALLDAGVAWAASIGAHKVTLEVWPHNEAAIALYRQSGFAVEGRIRRHYRRTSGELWDCLLMALVLDDTAPGSPHPDAAGL